MKRLFCAIDEALRGKFTSREALRDGRIPVTVKTLLAASLVLGVIYGAFMGLYAPLRPENPSYQQLLASMLKVPLLFLLTLVVTLPSLYVFSALAGSTLRFVETLRFLLIGILVNLALVASFGPVTGFFTLSTESYPFIVLLNVIVFTIGGAAGIAFVFKGLQNILANRDTEEVLRTDGEQVADDDSEARESSPDDRSSSRPARRLPPLPPRRSDVAVRVFYVWAIVFSVVGAQMGWILRPFIGSPSLPFQWFRPRASNFFEALGETLQRLFS